MLLNVFHVNAAHNAVHLLTGIVALLAGMAGVGAAKTFFKIFGVVYGLVAILGFVVGDGLLLGLISNNMADTWPLSQWSRSSSASPRAAGQRRLPPKLAHLKVVAQA